MPRPLARAKLHVKNNTSRAEETVTIMGTGMLDLALACSGNPLDLGDARAIADACYGALEELHHVPRQCTCNATPSSGRGVDPFYVRGVSPDEGLPIRKHNATSIHSICIKL